MDSIKKIGLVIGILVVVAVIINAITDGAALAAIASAFTNTALGDSGSTTAGFWQDAWNAVFN